MDKYRNFTDRQLIDAIIGGDKQAETYLLSRVITPNLHYLVTCRFKDFHIELNELLSDMYIHLQKDNWHILRQFGGKDGASLATYLQVVAYNLTHRKYILKGMKESRSLVTLNELAQEIADPGSNVQKIMADILELIPHLKNVREQQVIRFYLQGLKPPEIGKILQTSANAVSIIRSRACDHLKELINSRRI